MKTCIDLRHTMCKYRSFVKLPRAEPAGVPGEADGDTGGFDVRRYRARPDVAWRAVPRSASR
jgi:hypothetical protein